MRIRRQLHLLVHKNDVNKKRRAGDFIHKLFNRVAGRPSIRLARLGATSLRAVIDRLILSPKTTSGTVPRAGATEYGYCRR
jgi:hypothetical protein